MAYSKKKTKKGGPIEHEPFQVVGVLYEQCVKIELQKMDLPKCLFRVKVVCSASAFHVLTHPMGACMPLRS